MVHTRLELGYHFDFDMLSFDLCSIVFIHI